MITHAELPINTRGAVYHLDLTADEIADTVITVGDPARVGMVSSFFDSIEVKRSHREFSTHTGYLDGQRITVLSTGIGMPNIDIVINELDALVNVDLQTRETKKDLKKLSIIRLGTTGGIAPDCEPGDILLSRYAVGFDTIMNYYHYTSNATLDKLNRELKKHLIDSSGSFYVAESSEKLANQFAALGKSGITATCGGFYGPQGRQLRMPLRYPDFLSKLSQFQMDNLSIINLEMETAALYALSSLLGHHCLSISTVLANRSTGVFATDVNSCVEGLIKKTLDLIKRNHSFSAG